MNTLKPPIFFQFCVDWGNHTKQDLSKYPGPKFYLQRSKYNQITHNSQQNSPSQNLTQVPESQRVLRFVDAQVSGF